MVSATLVSFKLLAGKPMECWVPAEYQKGWEDYAGSDSYELLARIKIKREDVHRNPNFAMRTHPPGRFVVCMNFRYYEGYMTVLYLFIKFSYLCNAIGNMILMNIFLQTDDYTVYGIGVLIDLFRGKGGLTPVHQNYSGGHFPEWHDSGNFPRVTMCDMQIRVLGSIQRHTVQCVLVVAVCDRTQQGL
ncbi:unnamed protein product [Sphagnum balticum]